MVTFIIFIIYILIGIIVNLKYNKKEIEETKRIFPILSNFIIAGLIMLWPAIVCAKIENYFLK